MKYLKWFYNNFDMWRLIKQINSIVLVVIGIALINDTDNVALTDIVGVFLINAGYIISKGR